MKRSYLLLEVLVGLALLALLGVGLIRTQVFSLRQFHTAERQRAVAEQMAGLLWNWSETGTPVTLPGDGELNGGLRWRRTILPIRIAQGCLASQVCVTVYATDEGKEHEIYRVDWLMPEKAPKKPST